MHIPGAPFQWAGVHVQVELLTGAEAPACCKIQLAEHREKEEKKEEAKPRKAARLAEDQKQCCHMGGYFVFSGSLASKNKPVLQDITLSLNLALNGTKLILLQKIQDHLWPTQRLRRTRDTLKYLGVMGAVLLS
jgi:hypothetical protein